MGKRAGLVILVLVISGCVILSIGLIIGAVFLLKSEKNYVPPTAEARVATTVPVEEDVFKEMDEIQEQVLGIRGLSLNNDLQRDLMSTDQLREKLNNELFEDYTPEDSKKDGKILSTLGLIDPDLDLRQFYIDLYAEQIAGYYDSETKEMYVIADGAFGGPERMTYAHEFTHVLQDQNYDLENGLMLNDDFCEQDTEYCAAVTALIEGDAVLSEQFWLMQHSTRTDQQEIMAFYNGLDMPVYESAPEYIKRDLGFPYQEGFSFVEKLQGEGGWDAVDAAYANPPVTTEQILHPEKYPKDVPQVVAMNDLLPQLGEGWEEWDRNVMGEWYTYLILALGRSPEIRLDDAMATSAATGWGGDTYLFYISSATDEYLFAWKLVWDSPSDREEFFTAATTYGESRWGAPTKVTDTAYAWQSEVDGVIAMLDTGSSILWFMGSNADLVSLAQAQYMD